MTLYELAKERYSVRKFSEKAVEEEKLNKILEIGRIAPTAHNNQPQRIYVLKSDDAIAKIRGIAKCAFNAPVVLLICADTREGWVNPYNGRNAAEMDASIVTTQMMLQVTELGLGATWVCWFDTEKTKEVFSLPEGIEPYCLLPLGYPAENSIPSISHESRKSIDETVVIL